MSSITSNKRKLKNIIEITKELIATEVKGPTEEDDIHVLEGQIRKIKAIKEELESNTRKIEIIQDEWEANIQKLKTSERIEAENEITNFINENQIESIYKIAKTKIRNWNSIETDYLVMRSQKEPTLQNEQNTTMNESRGNTHVLKPPLLKHIPRLQKICQLFAHVRGEAAAVLKGIEPLEENYEVAIEILKEEFEKEETQIRKLNKELFGLKTSQNFNDDIKLLRDLQRINRLMKTHKQTINIPAISLMIEQKLSKAVLRQMLSKKRQSNEWNTEILIKNLAEIIKEEQAVNEVYKESHQEFNEDKRQKTPYKFGKTTMQYTTNEQKKEEPRRKEVKIQNQIQPKQEERSKPKWPCPFCNLNHWSTDCRKIPTAEERYKLAREKKLCINCLRPGHQSKECSTKNKICWFCKKQGHHQAICLKQFGKKEERKQINNIEEEIQLQSVRTNKEESNQTSILLTTTITVFNPEIPYKQEKVLCFFDSGSDQSYISKNLAEKLNLKLEKYKKVKLTGFAGANLGTYTLAKTKIGIQTKRGKRIYQMSATDQPLAKMTIVKIEGKYRELYQEELKVPNHNTSPEILIGNDNYNDFYIKSERRLPNGFWINESTVGKILSGQGNLKINNRNLLDTQNHHTKLKSSLEQNNEEKGEDKNKIEIETEEEKLTEKVERLLSKEMIGLEDASEISDEQKWMVQFENDIKTPEETGDRYEVSLPWNENASNLQSNFALARGRLISTLKRLRKDKKLLEEYDKIIKQQIALEIIEEVKDPTKKVEHVHYIPHQPVVKKDSGKVRIVYDASAKCKASDQSLNDCLEKGPILLKDLTGILIRTRLKEHLITGDIEKAFLQISIREKDRDALRFLWPADPANEESKIKTYRFKRVPFGIISSPAHLGIVVQHHLKKNTDMIEEDILKNIYVDNIIVGTDELDELEKIYRQLKEVFHKAKMNIREFISSDKEIINKIPEEDKGNNERTKLLGIEWIPEKDIYKIKLKKWEEGTPTTKRTILAHYASTFDPLGLLSPALLPYKLLSHKIWEEKTDWDQPVSKKLKEEWVKITKRQEGEPLEIPRKISKYKINKEGNSLQIFADASKEAMGIAAYLRCKSKEEIVTKLLFAKSLIVPIYVPNKHKTIPKLELQALKIATKIAKYLEKEIDLELEEVQLWTDAIDHIKGEENPADIATRGTSMKEIQNTNWLEGPSWLKKEKEKWPETKTYYDTKEHERKIKPTEITLMTIIEEKVEEIDTTRSSSWIKTKRVLALALRWKNKTTKNKNKEIRPTEAKELERSEKILIKNIQKIYPPNEEERKNLNIYEDNEEILRCKGRLGAETAHEKANQPIFLPKKARITAMIIKQAHIEMKHSGTNIVLAKLREKYWIPQARRTIRATIFNKKNELYCITCSKKNTKAYQLPNPPDLPIYRIEDKFEKPFSSIGLDNFGPFIVKYKNQQSKIWGLIFVCTRIRAIHIEVVFDLTADEFLAAFTRFIARRGLPKIIVSDNAKTFKKANKAISQLWQRPKETNDTLSNKGIEWYFNTEAAPWQGGLFERTIQMVKNPLSKTIGRRILKLSEMITLLTEIEKYVNERPLTYISENEINEVITPWKILVPYPDNEPILKIDEEEEEYIPKGDTRAELIKRYTQNRSLAKHYWDLWKKEYLPSLLERQRRKLENNQPPKVGELTLIEQSEGKRNQWKVGKIEKLYTGADDQIRSALVKVQGKFLKRPINKLYNLEINDKINNNQNINSKTIGINTNDKLNHIYSIYSKFQAMEDVSLAGSDDEQWVGEEEFRGDQASFGQDPEDPSSWQDMAEYQDANLENGTLETDDWGLFTICNPGQPGHRICEALLTTNFLHMEEESECVIPSILHLILVLWATVHGKVEEKIKLWVQRFCETPPSEELLWMARQARREMGGQIKIGYKKADIPVSHEKWRKRTKGIGQKDLVWWTLTELQEALKVWRIYCKGAANPIERNNYVAIRPESVREHIEDEGLDELVQMMEGSIMKLANRMKAKYFIGDAHMVEAKKVHITEEYCAEIGRNLGAYTLIPKSAEHLTTLFYSPITDWVIISLGTSHILRETPWEVFSRDTTPFINILSLLWRNVVWILPPTKVTSVRKDYEKGFKKLMKDARETESTFRMIIAPNNQDWINCHGFLTESGATAVTRLVEEMMSNNWQPPVDDTPGTSDRPTLESRLQNIFHIQTTSAGTSSEVPPSPLGPEATEEYPQYYGNLITNYWMTRDENGFSADLDLVATDWLLSEEKREKKKKLARKIERILSER
uniref:Uncharacterized protein n=1 Tax=Meloidogyne enterolobii TaxID=390850 RepID=A0A6V7WDM8_MELEN|nr:unnamed protein product [Meloidogyne enterolobii]